MREVRKRRRARGVRREGRVDVDRKGGRDVVDG